jgi:hypothetical protein
MRISILILAIAGLFTAEAHAGSASFQPKVFYDKTVTIVIATSTTVSPAVDLSGTQLVGIFVPATFEGTGITISASDTVDGTYVAVQTDHTSATAYPITTTASRYIPLDNLAISEGLRYIKITTGTAQTTTDTVFTLATKAR